MRSRFVTVALTIVGLLVIGLGSVQASHQDPEVVGFVDTIGPFSHRVAVDTSTNRIYVMNLFFAAHAPASITVIEGATDTVLTNFEISGDPQDFAINPATGRMYLTNGVNVASTRNTVTVIDLATNAEVASIDLDVGACVPSLCPEIDRLPTGIGVDVARNLVYTGNRDGSVSVIDGATNAVLDTILDTFPGRTSTAAGRDVAVNSVTGTVYVENSDGFENSSVAVIDRASNTLSFVDVARPSNRLAVNSTTNRVYVTTRIDLQGPGGIVTVIDGASNSVVAEVPVNTYKGIAVDPATDHVFVTGTGTGPSTTGLEVIDGSMNAVVGGVNTTCGNPLDVAVNPVTDRAYVLTNCDRVFVVVSGIVEPPAADVTPPLLTDLSIDSAVVDVTSGPGELTIGLDVTDDLAGVERVHVTLESPSRAQELAFFRAPLVAGDDLVGRYEVTIEIPEFVEAGTWQLTSVFVRDNALNSASYDLAFLQGEGFPTDVVVLSVPDVTPPELVSMGLEPDPVDASGGGALTVTLELRDDLAGVNFFSPPPSFFPVVVVTSPSGQNRFIPSTGFLLLSVSGGVETWQAELSIPAFSESGTWSVVLVHLQDAAGNMVTLRSGDLADLGLPTEFEVISDPTDTTPPELIDFDFTPAFINTAAGPQDVTVSLRMADSEAGISGTRDPNSFNNIVVCFDGPGGPVVGGQVCFFEFFSPPWELVSGTEFDGTWEMTMTFPQFATEGTWTVAFAAITDRVGNIQSFCDSCPPDPSRQSLASLGFPTRLVVVQPSGSVDGTIDATGGSVSDGLVELIFPADVLGAETDIAIDAFSDPLDIPLPVGFVGDGTLFVNIELTPEPDFPLPEPGLSVVLPMSAPTTPGTDVALYKVDPATALLTPALDTAGDPVVGSVDPTGLTATFHGVGSFSTLVGLVPPTLVSIDIMPADETNEINANMKGKGSTPVAIFSTPSFDATQIDPTTVLLGSAKVQTKKRGTPQAAVEDVNNDGLLDLVVHIITSEIDIDADTTELTLTAVAFDGEGVIGEDMVTAVGFR